MYLDSERIVDLQRNHENRCRYRGGFGGDLVDLPRRREVRVDVIPTGDALFAGVSMGSLARCLKLGVHVVEVYELHQAFP